MNKVGHLKTPYHGFRFYRLQIALNSVRWDIEGFPSKRSYLYQAFRDICMCVSIIQTYIYVYLYDAYILININKYIYACIHACIHIHNQACMYGFMYSFDRADRLDPHKKWSYLCLDQAVLRTR